MGVNVLTLNKYMIILLILPFLMNDGFLPRFYVIIEVLVGQWGNGV